MFCAQGQADRVNYLMMRQAKVVAMACTHAALKRVDKIFQCLKIDCVSHTCPQTIGQGAFGVIEWVAVCLWHRARRTG